MKGWLIKKMSEKFKLPTIEYDNAIFNQRKENIDNLLENLDSNDLKTKVENFAKRYGISVEVVENKIRDDSLFALQFSKDPAKQSIHQKIAASFIKNLPLVSSFEVLPQSGKNAYYIFNGVITKGENIRNTKKGKSIDFKWDYTFRNRKLQFYATHKYTELTGGAQDNQFDDVGQFLSNARDLIDNNVFLFSITDGGHYLGRETKISNRVISKINYLNQQYKGSRNYSTTSNYLLRDMGNEIIEWLNRNFSPEEITSEISRIKQIVDHYPKYEFDNELLETINKTKDDH